jgi:hypothetical protein
MGSISIFMYWLYQATPTLLDPLVQLSHTLDPLQLFSFYIKNDDRRQVQINNFN